MTFLAATAPHAAAQGLLEPFALAPADTRHLLRLDFQAMATAPRLAATLKARKAADPDFPASLIVTPAPAMAFLSRDFPGEIKLFEASGSEASHSAGRLLDCAAIYGVVDAKLLMERAQAAGWAVEKNASGRVVRHPQDKAFLTMPNDWTVLLATDRATLDKALAVASGAAPSMAKSQSSLGGLVRANASAPMMGGQVMSDTDRGFFAQLAADQSAPYRMFGGYADLVQALTRQQAGVVTIRNEAVQFDLVFDDPAASAKAATGANQFAVVLMQNAKHMYLQASRLESQMAVMGNVKFAAKGGTVTGSLTLADDQSKSLFGFVPLALGGVPYPGALPGFLFPGAMPPTDGKSGKPVPFSPGASAAPGTM